MSKRFWFNFENFCKGKVPSCLKKFLLEFGFDSDITIESINSDSIDTLEKHIDQRKSVLKNTVYKNCINDNKPFEFKLGHRICLLGLPDRIREYKKSIVPKKKEAKTLQSEEVLKNVIVEKLNGILNSLSADLTSDSLVSVADIFDFSEKDNICKCKVKCPLCLTETKKFTCTYRGYWSVSNLKRHWTNDHIQKVEAIVENPPKEPAPESTNQTPDPTKPSSSASPSTIPVFRVNQQALEDIQIIIDDGK